MDYKHLQESPDNGSDLRIDIHPSTPSSTSDAVSIPMLALKKAKLDDDFDNDAESQYLQTASHQVMSAEHIVSLKRLFNAFTPKGGNSAQYIPQITADSLVKLLNSISIRISLAQADEIVDKWSDGDTISFEVSWFRFYCFLDQHCHFDMYVYMCASTTRTFSLCMQVPLMVEPSVVKHKSLMLLSVAMVIQLVGVQSLLKFDNKKTERLKLKSK